MFFLLAACQDGQPKGPGDDDDIVGDDDDTNPGDDDDDDAPPALVGSVVVEGAGPTVRLVQRLTAQTTTPTTAVVRLDDGVRARILTFPDRVTNHDLLLLELHEDTAYDVSITLTDEAGRSVSADVAFQTDPLDLKMPTLELLVNDGAQSGVRVIPFGGDQLPYVILVVDIEGRPVFALEAGNDTNSVSFDPVTSTFGLIVSKVVERRDLSGAVVASFGAASGDALTPVAGVRAFHHEATFEPDGSFWAFHKIQTKVQDYPASYDDLLLTAPAQVDVDWIVHVAPDGTVLSDWSIADLLDTSHIGFGSLDPTSSGGLDWSHANGIGVSPSGDSIYVSMRHQDAVMKVDAVTGELLWLFAHPEGWPPDLAAQRLEGVGADFDFPVHAHAPFPTPDGFALFDNGNDRRTTPYTPVPERGKPYTRLVRFRVDEGAGTIEEAEEWVQIDGEFPLQSLVLGNCDVLPSGALFGTFSHLTRDGGVDNSDIGNGARSVRLIEVDAAAGVPRWDLRLKTDGAEAPSGVQVDRATWTPTLYAEGVATWE